jgi:hypothetical protein
LSIADDPFALFCLYYLGLTPEGEVRFFNANQLARRYNTTVPDLMELLRRHRLHPDAVLNTAFPLPKFQIEFQLAAEQEDTEQLRKRAQMVYRQFRENEGKRRDWLKEIEMEKEADRLRRGN